MCIATISWKFFHESIYWNSNISNINCWFLFCRILTPGRIIVEVNKTHGGGIIVSGKRDGAGFSKLPGLPNDKKQRLLLEASHAL